MPATIDNFALIIGSAKSGTTSLFEYLSEHPEVASCRHKELHFFSSRQAFNRGFAYYQSCWDWNSSTHKIALEATPNYTRVTHPTLLKAAEKIAEVRQQTQAKFKFIYLMRDPITRIESHYTHLEAWGQEPHVKPFAEGIDREIIDVSKYALQIGAYYQRFPAEDILLLNFKQLKNEPAKLLKKVCVFLDIDPEYQFQGLNTIHNDRHTRTKIALPGWQTIRNTRLMGSLAALTPKTAREAFRQICGVPDKTYIQLSPAEKQFVLTQLQADLEELNSKYGVDTTQWDNILASTQATF